MTQGEPSGGDDAPRRVKWGVLGAAGIAVNKVIPAMRACRWAEVVAIASRDAGRAREAADRVGVPRAYGSYEELLEDPEVEVVYNPLPNHLHVPWSIRAAEAGKHVLCEKPLALDVAEARELIAARDRTGVRVGEAFMVRLHPQWVETRRMVSEGRIGELRLISANFSYFKLDPDNIRNRAEMGGGALMDIGCYPVHLSHWLFGEEPRRVLGMVERDPDMGIDRLTSALLDFPSGRLVFSCSTQLAPFQRMELYGTRGRIEVEIPFNAPPDRATRLYVDDGRDLFGAGRETVEIAAADQYTIQGDRFSRAVLGAGEVPVSLEDALGNTAVIEAVFRSAESGRWEEPR